MHRTTLKAIVLRGILQDASGRDIPLRLDRATPEDVIPWRDNPASEQDLTEVSVNINNAAVDLPPPHDLVLEISLDKKLGSGDVGFVYGATPVFDGSSTSSALKAMTVPPLAVKIAGRARKVALDREAWFYNDLHRGQGSFLARCYGYFEAVVPSNAEYTRWSEEEESGHWNVRDSEAGLNKEEPVDTEDIYAEPYIKEDRVLSDKISVLLLERLSGKHLPLYHEFSKEEWNEIEVLYKELAQMRVEQVDCRHTNIMRVLECPPGLPGDATPYLKAHSSYRIIDLHRAQKFLDREISMVFMSSWSNVKRMMYNLSSGRVINSEDDSQ